MLEAEVGKLLISQGLTLTAAESCTGGLVSHRLTNVPGCSSYFLGSIVSYANEAKCGVLGVSLATLQAHGAVSPQTAEEMAGGARRLFGADIALAVTGVAGPGGGTVEKPVGLVFLHLSTDDCEWGERRQWAGGRQENKAQSAEAMLLMLQRYLTSRSPACAG